MSGSGANDGMDHSMEEGAREFERRAGALLSASADALDGHARSALTRARYAALEQVARPARRAPWRGWAPAGAVAMAMLVVVFYAGQRMGGDHVGTPAPLSSVDDMALVSDADGFDISVDADLDLDSDFYEWAAAKSGTSGNGLGS